MNQSYGMGGVAASTVAGTDYIYGHSGDNATDYNNEDGVNIGANDEDDIEDILYGKDKSGDLIDDKLNRGEGLSISNSIADFGLRSNIPKVTPTNLQSMDIIKLDKQKSSDTAK